MAVVGTERRRWIEKTWEMKIGTVWQLNVRLRKEVWRRRPSSWGEVVPVTETGTLAERGCGGVALRHHKSMRRFQDICLKMLCRHCDSEQIG